MRAGDWVVKVISIMGTKTATVQQVKSVRANVIKLVIAL